MSLILDLDALTLRGTRRGVLIRDLSLRVGAGEVVALAGEIDGIGEALARVIARGKRPLAGAVLADGAPLHRARHNDWLRLRRRIAVLRPVEEAPLNPRRPASDALTEPLDIHLPRLRADERQAAIAEAITRAGLEPAWLAALPRELSGIRRQLVALGRALIAGADLVLAVEPFRGLDPTGRARLMNRMIAVSQDHGVAWLLLTRDLAEAGHLAHRIGALRAGQMVEYGAACDLMLTPRHPYTQLLVNMRPDLLGGDFDHPRPPAPLPPAGAPVLRLPAPVSSDA